MKYFLLLFFCLVAQCGYSQTITELPAGSYRTKIKQAQNNWDRGDIIIIDDSHYKLSTGGEGGEYKFSVAAQRIFFTSGPLKSAFTKLSLVDGKPVIIIPVEQNSSLGITSEVWASKQ